MKGAWLAGPALLSLAVGCQPSDETFYGSARFPGVVKLDVTPKMSSLPIEGDMTAIIDFKAVATYSSGETRDLSRQVAWSIDVPSLGTFLVSRFQSTLTRGGQGVVTAAADTIQDQARVAFVYRASIVRGSAPSGAAALFRVAADDDGKQPRLTQPSDGATMPASTPQEFTWTPAAGTDLFELAFSNAVTDIRIYTEDRRATPTIEEWSILAATNPKDPVTVAVRGMSAASPTQAGASAPIVFTFAR